MAARAIGNATVSFGLVSIPTKVYTTNKTGASIRLRMMHPECAVPLKQQYIRPDTGDVVERSEMIKGYEFAKGQFVQLTGEEVKALDAVGNNAIELAEFVPASEMEPLYLEKSYYLGPDKGGERAYQLLRAAMVKTDLVGVAKYSARGKQHTVVVRPFAEGGIIMHQLRYADEIKSFDEIELEEGAEVSEAELGLAVQIIQQIAQEEFTLDKYKDEVRQRVLDLIQSKVDGKEISSVPQTSAGQVIDLMEALKASIGGEAEEKPKKKKKTTKKKAAND